ncbi:hypothetical protein GCM10022393_11050 [Aquimarina addita]|uniref:UspA domain-containing protein n=1 Tax=Aquimarina addita TaxID=870485 RepID=A0ABP7XDG5_9FLAO
MKTILYATDYTDHSLSALHYAYDLSSRVGAKLIILHVFDIPSFSGTTMISPLRKTVKRAYVEQNAVLKEYCKKHLGNDLEKLNVQTTVAKSISISEEVLVQTKRYKVDLVIVGVKDSNSKRGFFEGDIAKTLLTQLPCPLLVVPDHSSAKKINTIVYATDFEESDVFAIQELTALATWFEATIHVVHVSTQNDTDDKEQIEWFKEMVSQKVSYSNIEYDVLLADDVYTKLMNFLKSMDADMVVLLEREERGLLKKLFHKDLVKQVEAHTSIPLLSFNSKNQK